MSKYERMERGQSYAPPNHPERGSWDRVSLQSGVGLVPDERWAKGELRRRNLQHEFNGVSFHSTPDPTDVDPEDHLDRLLDRLRPAAQRIASLATSEEIRSARIAIAI